MKQKFPFCGLGYWPISDELNDVVTQFDTVASIKTGQPSKLLELGDIKDSCKGPGFWK